MVTSDVFVDDIIDHIINDVIEHFTAIAFTCRHRRSRLAFTCCWLTLCDTRRQHSWRRRLCLSDSRNKSFRSSRYLVLDSTFLAARAFVSRGMVAEHILDEETGSVSEFVHLVHCQLCCSVMTLWQFQLLPCIKWWLALFHWRWHHFKCPLKMIAK